MIQSNKLQERRLLSERLQERLLLSPSPTRFRHSPARLFLREVANVASQSDWRRLSKKRAEPFVVSDSKASAYSGLLLSSVSCEVIRFLLIYLSFSEWPRERGIYCGLFVTFSSFFFFPFSLSSFTIATELLFSTQCARAAFHLDRVDSHRRKLPPLQY